MSGHTPGPWRVWEVDGCAWQICEPDNSARHSHFARVKVGNMWGDEGKANARLIASAPELLEALVELVKQHKHIRMAESYPTPNSPATDAAETAIRKATGAAE